jgi:hypothetical protein
MNPTTESSFSDPYYFKIVADYINLNPARAGLAEDKKGKLLGYRWSRLSSFYDTWWADISRRHNETTLLHLGSEQENPVQLNAHDWMPPMSLEIPLWNQAHVEGRPVGNGTWHVRVRVVRGGRFELDFPAGETRIKTWLIEPEGETRGAYFVDLEHLQENQGN